MDQNLAHGLVFALGMVFLVKGSDIFVDASARLARKLGISELAIGLTLVAVGTSMPELASSIIAAITDVPEIVVGNVVGSNIANICFIVGIAAMIRRIKANELMVFRDGSILLFITLLFYLFMWGHLLPAFTGLRVISWVEGIFFLALFLAYTAYVIEKKKPAFGRSHLREFLGYAAKMRFITTIKDSILRKRAPTVEEKAQKAQAQRLFREAFAKDVIFALAGLFALIVGARYVVAEAVWGAAAFGIPRTVIGMTAVALGTSLPELAVAVSAARKGFGDIVVGNVMGSNITNILLVSGASSLIAPLRITKVVLLVFGPFMVASTVILLVIMRTRWNVTRIEGVCLTLLYLAFLAIATSSLFIHIPFLI